MAQVSIRELRNHGGEVVDRAARGEQIMITRGGKPVAQLRGMPRAPLTAKTLLARWNAVPKVDPAALRADVDLITDAAL